jgi:uncharacterized membrane protein
MKRRGKASKIILIFFTLFFIWMILQFIAPISLPDNSINNFTGSTILLDNENSINEIPFPYNLVYSTGDRLCHQKSHRSLFLNNNQMPFCSRCTAIWVGLTISFGLMIFYNFNLDNKFIFLLIFSLIPIGIDGIGQFLGFWESTNLIRIITGLFVGIMFGIALTIIIDELRELYEKRRI